MSHLIDIFFQLPAFPHCLIQPVLAATATVDTDADAAVQTSLASMEAGSCCRPKLI